MAENIGIYLAFQAEIHSEQDKKNNNEGGMSQMEIIQNDNYLPNDCWLSWLLKSGSTKQ